MIIKYLFHIEHLWKCIYHTCRAIVFVLFFLLQESAAAKVIVFLSSRDSVDFHCSLFKECLRSQSSKLMSSLVYIFRLNLNLSVLHENFNLQGVRLQSASNFFS